MKKMMRAFFHLLFLLALTGNVLGGDWTDNQFIYKPAQGARGLSEKANYDLGMNRLDVRLGKEIWVGDPKCGTTFQEAITTIGITNAILRVPAGIHTVNNDLSVPGNITVMPVRGAVFAVATTKTLTLNAFEAGPHQIFSCTGTGKVVFGAGAVKEVHPEWWGIDGTADHAEINAAITACPTGAAVALSKTYATTGTISLATGTILISRGAKIDGNYGGILLSMGHKSKILGHLEIDGNDVASSIGIQYGPGPVWWTWIESAWVHHCAAKGVYLYSDDSSGVYYNTCGILQINNCGDGMKLRSDGPIVAKVNSNGFNLVSIQTCTNGLVVDFAQGINFNHLEVEDCTGWGIDLVRTQGFYINGGWLELNAASGSPLRSTQDLRIANGTEVQDVDISIFAPQLFTAPVSLSYTFASTRSVNIRSGQYERKLGRTMAEQVDIGPGGIASDDLSAYDKLRVAGGQYCYRFSSGAPYYYFTAPTAAVGFSFRNNGTSELFKLYGSTLGSNETVLGVLVKIGTNTPVLKQVTLVDDPADPTNYQLLRIHK